MTSRSLAPLFLLLAAWPSLAGAQSNRPDQASASYYPEAILNTGKGLLPSAPVTAFAHIGLGNNIIYVDPEHDVVAVMRWIEGGASDGFVKRLLAALD